MVVLVAIAVLALDGVGPSTYSASVGRVFCVLSSSKVLGGDDEAMSMSVMSNL